MEYRSLYALGKEKLAAAGIPEADLSAIRAVTICWCTATARLQRQSSRRMSSCLQNAQSISRCSS